MNIYQIQQDLLAIFDELEENGGELTEELEQKLAITQEEFKDKVEDYTNVIKSLESDMNAIKVEQARLKALYDRKENVAKKLKEIIINAINEFGDTKKSGVKYLDYGTGEVSVRKTQAVEVNEPLVKYVGDYLGRMVTFNKECNQLGVIDHIDKSEIVTDVAQNTDMAVGGDDLDHINVDLSITIPLKDLATGEGYPALREIAKYSDFYKLSTSVSKSAIKPELKENGSCMPNLAKLSTNESLSIK
jgi:predicted nuclease with TOPRIM domain